MRYKMSKKTKRFLSRAVAVLMIVTCCMPITAFAGSEELEAPNSVVSPVVVEQGSAAADPAQSSETEAADPAQTPENKSPEEQPSAEQPADSTAPPAVEIPDAEENGNGSQGETKPENTPDHSVKPSEPSAPGGIIVLDPSKPLDDMNTMQPDLEESSAITTLEIPMDEMPQKPEEIQLKNEATVEFYNGGSLVEDGENIDPEQSMEIKIGFELSNESLSNIHPGDFTIIDMNIGEDSVLKLSSGGSAPVNLIVNDNLIEIGTLEVSTDGLATIEYNDAFQQEGNDFLELKGTFALKLSLDSSIAGGDNENKIFQILGKEYTIDLQPHPQVELSKEHEFDRETGIIHWTLTVTPNKDVKSYAGYVLTDNLPKDQVTYVEGSCTVSDDSGSISYDQDSGALTVAFDKVPAEDVSAPADSITIAYQTKVLVPAGKIDQFSIANTAVMSNAETKDSAKAADTVEYTPNLITKSATKTSTGIEWKIVVNQDQLPLENAVVTDDLDAHLALAGESASVLLDGKELPTSGGQYYEIKDQKLTVFLGNIDKKTHTITVKTKITDGEFGKYSEQSISNTARLSWGTLWDQDGMGSYAESKCSVKVGNAVLTKSGGKYDPATHQIPWTVKVDAENISMNNARLVDFFVYREDGSLIQSSSWNVEQALINKLGLKDDAKSVAINQHYVSGSLTVDGKDVSGDSDVVTVQTETLKVVNEELQVDIVSIQLGDLDHTATTVKLSSEVVKAQYGSNTQNNSHYMVVNNRIYLYDGSDKLISAVCGWSRLTSWVMAKSAGTYNYADRTLDWGLHVNWNQMEIAKAVVKDLLPEGFDVVQSDSEDAEPWFDVYEGKAKYVEGNVNGYVEKGTKLDGDTVENLLTAEVKDGADGRKEVVFAFTDNIPKGSCYYIEIHTRLTDNGAQKLFLEDANVNKLITVANEASLTGSEIYGAVKSKADAKIRNTVVAKYGSPNPQNQSVDWTVNVNSNQVDLAMKEADHVTLVDVIPDYLKLTTKNGIPEAAVWEFSLDTKGEPVVGDPLSAEELQKYLSYDRDTRELRFELPKSNGSYKLQFNTVLIDTNVSQIVNTVKLEGVKIDPPTSQSTPIQIEELLAGASAQYAGKITVIVTETNKNDVLLPGAELTLYKIGEDGIETQVGDPKISDSNGRVSFGSLEPGQYIVRQTAAPEGYEASTVTLREVAIDTTTDNWGDRIKTVFFDNPKRQGGGTTDPGQPGDNTGGNTGGGTGGGGGNPENPYQPQTPDMIIPENEVPAGPTKEVEIPDDDVPAGAAVENGEVNIADNQVPGGEAKQLPKTGGISPELFYGLGILITAGGLWMRKKTTEKKDN